LITARIVPFPLFVVLVELKFVGPRKVFAQCAGLAGEGDDVADAIQSLERKIYITGFDGCSPSQRRAEETIFVS